MPILDFMQRSKLHLWMSGDEGYSITSSARASSVGGRVRLRALAVLRLMTSSNFLGRSNPVVGR